MSEECSLELQLKIKLNDHFDYDIIQKSIEDALKTIPENIGKFKEVEITDIYIF